MGHFENYYHLPQTEKLRLIEERISPSAKTILEIGPGFLPFPSANLFLEKPVRSGSVEYPDRPGPTVYVDVTTGNLPFADKSIDFVYCRHVVEDLTDPRLLLSEIGRVAKAGYIETPSPAAEWSRHIDHPTEPCPWRGYCHHHWFAWVEDERLHMLAKYPVVEHMNLGKLEDLCTLALRQGPGAWTSDFFFEGQLGTAMLSHENGMTLGQDYASWIAKGISAGMRQSG